jgi:hypothetical protein
LSIFDQHSTGVRAFLRTGRHGAKRIHWNPPFESALYIEKDAQGHCCGVALQDADFADIDPRHHAVSDRMFDVEEYVLEILELPSNQLSLPL